MTLPTLYKKTSTGKIQEWTIKVVPTRGDVSEAEIVTTYGQTDGKKQEARELITEGKNIGKANETTALQQAEAEAQSQWEKKVKKGYVQNIEDAEDKKVDSNFVTGGVDPMLAHSYDKQGHKIMYPAFVQPKLDGHRCIAIINGDGEVTLWSRTRKPINSLPHLVDQLRDTYADIAATLPTGQLVLDGELYNHDYRDRFEDLTSKIRQSKPQPGHEVVEYWIYDMATDDYDFHQRQTMLEGLKSLLNDRNTGAQLRFVLTHEVADKDEMVETFGVFIEAGFEGLMARNFAGKYKHGRSYDLQKVKLMQDAEFTVVAIEEGRGKMAGLAMFVCETDAGQRFRVKMKGKLDDLKDYFDNPDPWIGKQLTVQFQKFSADGLPIFPVALRFRKDV